MSELWRLLCHKAFTPVGSISGLGHLLTSHNPDCNDLIEIKLPTTRTGLGVAD
ncbi:MAG: hypothetical protein JJU32_06500 [Phormidium sp. BM_Day4_Bin.17]|nr:hypothetical protein [Phormidium sp. BM_Day4_Bin.17]UCJ12568.1 MAG: hypothetical protein JWS08_01715 [Phormidium sp. PBR-2020]